MRISLDVFSRSFNRLECKQGDDLTLEIELYKEGQPYLLTNVTPSLNVCNSLNQAIIQTQGITKKDNVLTIQLLRDATRVQGDVKAEIKLVEGDKQKYSFTFVLAVYEGTLQNANVQPSIMVDIVEVLQTTVDKANVVMKETEQMIATGGAATKGDIATINSQLDNIENKSKKFASVKDFKCDDGQYVQGDGKHDDTTGIQRALDTASGVLFFPQGNYRITKGLILNNNIDIIGTAKRTSIIRGDFLQPTEDLLHIKIKENWGFGDVRNWRINNLDLQLNQGGRYNLNISEGMQMLTCEIKNCGINKLYIKGILAHSTIKNNTIGSAYLSFYDANLIEKNLFSGDECGITLDLIEGVRNNIIRDNTIVCRDGSIKILNGDNVRFENNQCEQPALSQGLKKAMVEIYGVDRACINIIISKNNFGGGTNLDSNIYLHNAKHTVINHNNFVATNICDIEIEPNCLNTFISPTNFITSSEINKRDNNIYNLKIIDKGENLIGYKCVAENLSSTGSISTIKDNGNVVNVVGYLNATSIVKGTKLCNVAKHHRPKINSIVPVSTDGGLGTVKHTYNGIFEVENIPTQNNISILPYSSYFDDLYTNVNFARFTNFNNVDTLDSGQSWENSGGVMTVADNEVTPTTNTKSTKIVNCNQNSYTVQLTLPIIYSGFTNHTRLIFRYQDTNNYMYLTYNDVNGYKHSVRKVVNGVDSFVIGVSNSAFKDGDVLQVINVVEKSKILLNGSQVFEINDMFLSTSTKCGFEFEKIASIPKVKLFGVINH